MVAMNEIRNEIQTTLFMDCPICTMGHSVQVGLYDYTKYLEGELAQNAFPYLNATEREQIITRICPNCQKYLFDEE